MKQNIKTPYGEVRIGTKIKIIKVCDTSASFAAGVDEQARKLNGKTGEVTCIDDAGQLIGTWGGLSLIPETDVFEIIN